MNANRVDTAALRAKVDIAEVVGRYVKLKRDGKEFKGCCPFHKENTPSFYVTPAKGFVHCFGCGAHGDVIDFVMRYENIDFAAACERLGHREFAPAVASAPVQVASKPREGKWVPLLPVPDDAPELLRADGWTVPLWNPKRDKFTKFNPVRADAYRDAEGRLLGYVLRCEFKDGKITPTVTWCVGPDGAQQWCVQHFPRPRPLLGLDDLAARPDAPVILVEGEKCRAASAGALPMYVAVSWPGGGKGVPYVFWGPLRGRDIIFWPDADEPGRQAMLGYHDYQKRFHWGIAQYLFADAKPKSLRMIDTEGQPKGWDIADAVADDWTRRQIAAWAAARIVDIDMVPG